MSAVMAVPNLTEEEERHYAIRLFDDPSDRQAAHMLVTSYLKLVVTFARSYYGYGLPTEDLIQEGNIGLMHAVRKYNPHLGVKLYSYATVHIKAAMADYVVANYTLLKMATTKPQRKLFFNLRQMLNGRPLNEDMATHIAAQLNVEVHDVREMYNRFEAPMMYIDQTYGSHDEDGHSFNLADMLLPSAPSAESEYEDFVREHMRREAIQSAFAELTEQQQALIQRRWLCETPATLAEIASEDGCSHQAIASREKTVLAKMRKLMLAHPGGAYLQ